MSESETPGFEGMNRRGFFVYVQTSYVAYGKPPLSTVVERAKELDPESTMKKQTVSDVLRAKGFPRLETARRMGLGIGGEELGRLFEQAWRAARDNHRTETHAYAAETARDAQSSGHLPLSAWFQRYRVLLVQVLLMLVSLIFVGVSFWIEFR
ncbi:hypothetical protein [Streptomyces parvulus]